MKKLKKKTIIKKRGVALLVAILVSSVALAVGLGVYNRTYKELIFASFWKQTLIASSAADSGLECALYWELNPAANAKCFKQTVSGPLWTPGEFGSFQADIIDGVGPCVKVVIDWNAGISATTTVARGYNVSCAEVDLGINPRVVERGFGFSL